MPIIAPTADIRPRPAALSTELRLDVLGPQALAGLEWTAPTSSHDEGVDDVLARIDQALAEVVR